MLSAKDSQLLAARWFRRELEELEQAGSFRAVLVPGDATSFETPYGFEEYQEWLSLREALDQGSDIELSQFVSKAAIKALRIEGIPAPVKDSPAYALLCSALPSIPRSPAQAIGPRQTTRPGELDNPA